MPTYQRRTRVAAPLEDVWAFHSTVEGLTAVTPDFLDLRVEAVIDPDGDVASDPADVELVEGCRLRLSIVPLGVGPRQRWTSRITDRSGTGGTRWFEDVMVDGPFATWEHTHLFFGDGDETIIEDRVRYDLPLGAVGRALGPVAVVGFQPMFRFRHRRTRTLLEGRR